nr:M12 family metallo-peptidase [Candidatus Kapabacteria bacterium]
MRLITIIFTMFLGILARSLHSSDNCINADLYVSNNSFLAGKLNKTLADTGENELLINDDFFSIINSVEMPTIRIHNMPLLSGNKSDWILSRRQSIVDADTRFILVDSLSEMICPPVDIQLFDGYLSDDPETKVFLAIGEKTLYASIQYSDGKRVFIAPIIDNSETEYNHVVSTEDNALSLFKELNVTCPEFDNKNNELQSDDFDTSSEYKFPLKTNDNLLEAKLIIEATSSFYEYFEQDFNKVNAYIISVMSLASRIYEQELNIKFYLTEIKIHRTAGEDPYTNYSYMIDKLIKFRDQRKNDGNERALACLFTSMKEQPAGAKTLGLSFVGEPYNGNLCDRQWGYCTFAVNGNYKYPIFDYTLDVIVAAHEIGHGFGSPHTHTCFWRPNLIDTCVTKQTDGIDDACYDMKERPAQGTIMSYCHLTNSSGKVDMIFHDRVKKIIRFAAEHSECVSPAEYPTISLLSPIKTMTYIKGEELLIQWKASRVSLLTINYTTDNGETWVGIDKNILASDDYYAWTLPIIDSDNIKIIVHDKYKPAVADTSVFGFSILPTNEISDMTNEEITGLIIEE